MGMRLNVLLYLYGNVEDKWPNNLAAKKWDELSNAQKQGELVEALLPLHTKPCEKLLGKTWPGFVQVRVSGALDPHIPLVLVTASCNCRCSR